MPFAHYRVTGRVQRVGFRWFVREKARRLDLAGWVRNLTDGSVEIAAAGHEENLHLLHQAIRAGPAGASVAEVQALPIDRLGDLPKPFAMIR